MKKVIYGFIILLVLFIGVLIGEEPGTNRAKDIQSKIDIFEEDITKPGNDYNYKDNIITKNNNNKIAKKGDSLIKGLFDLSIGILKGAID